MVGREGLGCSEFQISGFGLFSRTVIALWVIHCLVSQPVDGLRPLRERARSWGDEVCRLYFFEIFLWALMLINVRYYFFNWCSWLSLLLFIVVPCVERFEYPYALQFDLILWVLDDTCFLRNVSVTWRRLSCERDCLLNFSFEWLGAITVCTVGSLLLNFIA